MSGPGRAAVGFFAHTGWATAVALSGTPDAPRVAARCRVELWDDTDPQAYHQAAELDPGAARELIARAEVLSRRKAVDSLQAFFGGLDARPFAAVIAGGNARIPADLAAVLRSHPLVHAAEGELFRRALATASAAADLRVQVVPAREVHRRAAEALGLPAGELSQRIAELGRAVGSPWGKEQKDCAAAAWLGLAGAHT